MLRCRGSHVPTDLDDHPPSWADRTRTVLVTLAGLAALTAVARRLVEGAPVWLLWADRDLARAAAPWAELPATGAELSYGIGARVPGGALYLLLHAAQSLADDPVAVWRCFLVLDVVALLAVAGWVWRRVSPSAGVVAGATWALSCVSFDTQRTLWNPGLLPLFVAVPTVIVLDALHTRRATWVPVALGLLAVGAQLHLTAGSLAAVLVVALLVSRPDGWARSLTLGGLAAVTAYLPYLRDEAARGWPNTTALAAQRQVDAVTAPGAHLANLSPLAGLLGGPAAPGGAHRAPELVVASLLGSLPLLFALTAVAMVVRSRDAATRAAAAVLLSGAGWLLIDDAIDLTISGSGRYLVATLPAWCVLVATGAHRLAARATRPWVALAPWALVSVGLISQATVWHAAHVADQRAFRTAPGLTAQLDAIGDHAGLTLEGVAGRTMFWFRDGQGRWAWRASDGIDDLLRRAGTRFPGSLPPPCLLLLEGRGPTPPTAPDDNTLATTLASPLAGVHVLDVTQLGRDLLVRWTHDGALCPTTLVDRYVLTEPEVRTEDVLRRHRVGDVVPDPAVPPGVTGWTAVLDGGVGHAPFAVRVDLLATPAGVRAALHSNQLRGRAWNSGFFDAVLVAAPRLVLHPLSGATPDVVLSLAEGWVGAGAALPPLITEPVPVASAEPYEVTLDLRVVDGFDAARWPPNPAVPDRPVQVVLGTWMFVTR